MDPPVRGRSWPGRTKIKIKPGPRALRRALALKNLIINLKTGLGSIGCLTWPQTRPQTLPQTLPQTPVPVSVSVSGLVLLTSLDRLNCRMGVWPQRLDSRKG